MKECDIAVLDLTPVGGSAGHWLYKFVTSYPWVRTTDTVRQTKADAYTDAEAWIKDYISGATWARMGHAIGVAERDGGYVGVVNYYHSNS